MRWFLLGMILLTPDVQETLEITKDTTLDPKKTYGPIVIKASNVTIDGRGAWVVGDMKAKSNARKGVGITARGVSNVTLKNVNVKGFETGLKVDDGEGWTIEGCDFSDNFHDPDFGWGENGRRGGMVITKLRKSKIAKNKSNRNWDACNLVECDENTIEENDFSRCSNTCLKFWTCCSNLVKKNNLSWGIRISPGEVHARDSTSVLIESGSNNNRFLDNDATHGGDGIFVRILNGWVCTGNTFEGNDVSYANNNGFEAWSPGNTYVRNKANYCSYGFWLGASDKTVLIENEAAFSGVAKGSHNSPHLPEGRFAGIVFMFGPSSHTILRGNHGHDNNGAGIAAIGDDGGKFKAYHWIVEQNRLEDNRWGFYVKNADWVDIAANTFKGNKEDIKNDGNVTNITHHKGESKTPPRAIVKAPKTFKVGEKATFDASSSEGATAFRWDLGDGTVSKDAKVEHAYKKPGFYRCGVTVNNGTLSDLGWVDVFVTEDVDELKGEWDWVDPGSKVMFGEDAGISGTSTRAIIDPYSGGRTNLRLKGGWKKKDTLVFWLKYTNSNIPAWQDANPIVTLHESDTKFQRLTPNGDFMSNPPYIEGREGWNYFVVPLAGDKMWKREGEIEKVNWITIGVDSWGGSKLIVWLDGLAFK